MLPRRNLASQPVRGTSTPGRRVPGCRNRTGHGDSAPIRPEKWRKSGFPRPTNGLVTQVTGGCASSKSALCLRHAEPGLTSLRPVSSFLSRFPPWGSCIALPLGCCLWFCSWGRLLPSRRRCRCRRPTRIALASSCRLRPWRTWRVVITTRHPRFISMLRRKRLPLTRSPISASAAATMSVAVRWPARNGRKSASGNRPAPRNLLLF
jgi:hypothetical protein